MERMILDVIVLAGTGLMCFVLGRDVGFQEALKLVANGVKIVLENHLQEDEDEE